MNSNEQNFNFNNFDFNTTAYDYRTVNELLYSSKRNLLKLTMLINRLFELHSRMLVVRIDLRYKKEVGRTIPLGIIQMHREQLLADRRKHPNEFEDMLGYAWCLEYGEQEGGFHYHLLAFYNGADRRGDIGIGLALRDLWGTITGGYGQCYISNFDKEKLGREGCLGIGMIHRDDVSLRINLIEKVAAYITKKCTVFDIQSDRTHSGEFRTFGKSKMPKPLDPNVPRRGRPPASSGTNW
ncbi:MULTISPECIES: inovirus-type Gp2 protein [unclassified Polaromonas]|uniref:YagK/YfjJ domain-containing protein n=1 Tax=unclassified Polaromonas TaxID=2638319 RepID=UPI0018CAD839|nr:MULTISPECIES: inovirus-type Gp2 protein [unclassified Polaromonas]MBG6073440.1 hypothetical protein [Polaromonas sp. CG_9.7]MBG6115375.1 hypothetical protein [Polaromonas sp. CG_9.2]